MARPLPTIAASAARTTTGNSGPFRLPPEAEYLSVLVNVTAVSGTPSNVISVEWSNDGTNFAQGDPADAMTALTAVGTKVKTFQVRAMYARVVWTISGGTPSETFDVTGVVTGSVAFP